MDLNYRYELQIKLMLQKMEEEKKKLQLDMAKQIEESKNMYHLSRLSKMDVEDLKKLQQTTQNNLNLIVDLIVQRSFTNTDSTQKKVCVVCMENEAVIALIPCGHCCLCEVCSMAVISKCPIDNQPIESRLKLFHC